MRFMRERRAFDHLRVARQRGHHGLLVGFTQAVEAGGVACPVARETLFFQLPEHAVHARVRVLDIKHRVVV